VSPDRAQIAAGGPAGGAVVVLPSPPCGPKPPAFAKPAPAGEGRSGDGPKRSRSRLREARFGGRRKVGFAQAGSPRPAEIEGLRARIRALELGDGAGALEVVSLGAALDRALPWGGLVRGALHEVAAAPAAGDGEARAHRAGAAPGLIPGFNPGTGVTAATGAATGFAAGLLACLADADKLALWCLGAGDLYAPGLPAFGLDPARLVVVRARRAGEVLWVLEEALSSGRFAAVLGEDAGADLVAARRLQLAARARGSACLLLDRAGAAVPAASALSRWRVAPAPGGACAGGGVGSARWQVELARCRGGAAPRRWTLEWCHETSRFAVAAVLADRPSVDRSRLSVGDGRPR